jgi:hypothetical protein
VKEGDFIYLYEEELRNPFQLLLVGWGAGWKGAKMGAM